MRHCDFPPHGPSPCSSESDMSIVGYHNHNGTAEQALFGKVRRTPMDGPASWDITYQCPDCLAYLRVDQDNIVTETANPLAAGIPGDDGSGQHGAI